MAKQKITNETVLSAGGQAANEAAVPFINNFAATGLPAAQSTVVGFNPNQTAAQGMVTNAATGMDAQAQQAASTSADLQHMDYSPFLGQAINYAVQPMQQQYQDADNAAQTEFMGPGGNSAGFGGSRMFNYKNRLASDSQRNIGGVAATMANDAYGKNLDASVKALALAPQTQNMMLGGAKAVGTVGDVQQQQAQAEADANYAASRENSMKDYTMAQALLGLASNDPAKSSVVTAPKPETDWLSAALGAAGSVATMIPFL